MTIKRRLFISNILMIILPIILTIAMVIAMYFAFIGITGIDPFSIRLGGISYVNESNANEILKDENHTQIASDISVYQLDTDSYIIVLPDDVNKLVENYTMPYYIPLTIVLVLLVIVFLTNRTLTKHISHRIMTSINTLVDGVQELSDGNLNYRIQYTLGDEFDGVCADFNEMASRLSDMVNQRQLDERNRKELIAGISHDLRTPLTSIKGHIEGIKKGIASTPEMQEKYLDIIQSKTQDIEYIIKQLFLFSKMDIGEFPFRLETVDIGDELSKMVAGLTDEYMNRGLAISLTENTHNELVSIDIVQFRNVVQNILDNSVKYGGKSDVCVEMQCHKNEDSVMITINDNGPGVSDVVIDRMFDAFYREDLARTAPNSGSGLGLAISSKIIERLKGTIAAENLPNGGLSIIITLPAWKGEPQHEKNTNH